VVVLHRTWLSPHDAERVACLRASAGASLRRSPLPRVILCVSPHVRYAELERWSAQGLMDAIVPEATAHDTIARHVAASAVGSGPPVTAQPRPKKRTRVAVVSANSELRQTLTDACAVLGYSPEPASDWPDAARSGLALWDVPVLEPEWPRALAQRTRLGAVLALLGFASRVLVAEARAQGAAACLELPYDLLDLDHVLGRITTRRTEPAHLVPPRPSASRRHAASSPNPAVERPPVVGPLSDV
jgi:hypothetical protein